MGLKVRLVLPRRRLWRWHATLVEALARRGDLEVRLAPSPPYPQLTRGWLALERAVFGPAAAAAIGPEGLGIATIALDVDGAAQSHDLLIDLRDQRSDEDGGAARLSVRFDGRGDERTLFAALQARRSPLLEVVQSDGRVLAASYPAVEVRGELGRSLGYIHARLTPLILRALDALDAMPSPAVPPPAPVAAPGATVTAFARRALADKFAAKLSRGRSDQETWRIALRRAPMLGDAPPRPQGFEVIAGPDDAFHADPFLFAHGGETFLFVEAYPWSTHKGVVACARLDASGRPGAFETVLETSYHLSYPQVFAFDGEIYMMPETAAARRVELYRATQFPHGWELVAVMLEGQRIADATLLQEGAGWWLFASVAQFGGANQDELFAWHGPSPLGPWTAHARKPLVSDVRNARPAGRFVRRGQRLYRPAQDSEAGYGAGLAWCEVLELSPKRYRETVAARWSGADFGPYTGVHTFTEAGGWEAIDLKSPRGR